MKQYDNEILGAVFELKRRLRELTDNTSDTLRDIVEEGKQLNELFSQGEMSSEDYNSAALGLLARWDEEANADIEKLEATIREVRWEKNEKKDEYLQEWSDIKEMFKKNEISAEDYQYSAKRISESLTEIFSSQKTEDSVSELERIPSEISTSFAKFKTILSDMDRAATEKLSNSLVELQKFARSFKTQNTKVTQSPRSLSFKDIPRTVSMPSMGGLTRSKSFSEGNRKFSGLRESFVKAKNDLTHRFTAYEATQPLTKLQKNAKSFLGGLDTKLQQYSQLVQRSFAFSQPKKSSVVLEQNRDQEAVQFWNLPENEKLIKKTTGDLVKIEAEIITILAENKVFPDKNACKSFARDALQTGLRDKSGRGLFNVIEGIKQTVNQRLEGRDQAEKHGIQNALIALFQKMDAQKSKKLPQPPTGQSLHTPINENQQVDTPLKVANKNMPKQM